MRYASADDHLIAELDRQLLRKGHSRPCADFSPRARVSPNAGSGHIAFNVAKVP
ncbi:hypothetical protein [Streptomyces sp. NPDC005407]|uniref:hypothetical protein n=1 Tax=Streptomyces sp. NPDC005407 TaxID=3155340 RepID=UPI0033A60D53